MMFSVGWHALHSTTSAGAPPKFVISMIGAGTCRSHPNPNNTTQLAQK
jgi:hypothetical protein